MPPEDTNDNQQVSDIDSSATTGADGEDENTDVAQLLAETRKLQRDLENARKEAIAAKKEASDRKKQLAKFDGFDPDEFVRKAEADAAQRQQELVNKGEYEKALEKFKVTAQTAEQQAQAAREEANKAKIESKLSIEFLANGGNPRYLPLFIKSVEGVSIEEGAVKIPMIMDANGQELSTLGQYVSHLREGDLALFFEPQSKAAGSNDTGGKPPKPRLPKTVRSAEASAYISEIAAGEVVIVD
jgi:hypothetical protein